MALLRNGDRLELITAQAIVEAAREIRNELDEDLARMIRNEIADALG